MNKTGDAYSGYTGDPGLPDPGYLSDWKWGDWCWQESAGVWRCTCGHVEPGTPKDGPRPFAIKGTGADAFHDHNYRRERDPQEIPHDHQMEYVCNSKGQVLPLQYCKFCLYMRQVEAVPTTADEIKDLEKAIWWMRARINHLEGKF